MSPAPPFCYEGFDLDPERGLLTCRYSLGGRDFTEEITFGPGGNWDDPAVAQAARLICLLAGVSYYKTTAPPVIDLGRVPVTADERAFLRRYYVDGLGEFAYRNDLDLSALQFTGGVIGAAGRRASGAPAPRTPLIPFGGGIDSIVTVDAAARAGRRGAVRREPAGRPLRRHRGPGRGHRAAGRPRRPARSTRWCAARTSSAS